MVKCSFCSRQIEAGRGLIYVAPDRVYNLCSSKCRKNLNLGRDKSRLAWIRKSQASKAVLKEELLQAAKEQAEKKEEKAGKKQEPKPEVKKEEKPAENKQEEKK